MSKKENTKKGLGPGELNTIRDILMGQQISEFDERFGELEVKFESFKDQILLELRELKTVNDKSQKTLESNILNKFSAFEKLIEKNHAKSQDDIKKLENDFNDKIAGVFIEFGKSLLTKK